MLCRLLDFKEPTGCFKPLCLIAQVVGRGCHLFTRRGVVLDNLRELLDSRVDLVYPLALFAAGGGYLFYELRRVFHLGEYVAKP